MGYTIFTPPQITPATVVRTIYGQGDISVENPEQVALPAGTSVVYTGPNYSRFSAITSERTMLLHDPQGMATEAEILAAFPNILDKKLERLWQCAHEYEQRFISGVALSVLSIGVTQNKPKCMAFAAWSDRLWNQTYYPRKAALRFDSQPDYDFSVVGEPPYTVPELSAEVWGV